MTDPQEIAAGTLNRAQPTSGRPPFGRFARFFKCDLQMQTPVDRFHWLGPERVNPDSSAQERRTIAEAFMRRCYEVHLEVIGITDHNLAPADCESLIPELSAANGRLAREFGYEIALFPGFEIEVTVGRGIHVLCLFEPGTSVQTLSDKLAQLHLPVAARYADGQPRPVPPEAEITFEKLIRIIQGDSDVPGLVILAHASGDSGVMDSDKVVQWWSADVIRDDRVLCMELPFPRSHYLGLPDQPLTKSVLQNRDTRYQRRHPIASICSSDSKALSKADGITANYIGHRHTWLKFGTPTIEGLRQAFLDHESRVRFGEKSPDATDYPRISSVAITDAAFLADQTLNLSPNLNVIIGGSGTGKSTIVNYLRMCLGQADLIRGQDVRDNYDRIARTIKPQTRVEAQCILSGDSFLCRSVGPNRGDLHAPGGPLDGVDISSAFPVRFFGQREIYNIADDRAATVGLVDDLHRDELSRLQRQAQTLTDTHESLDARARALNTLRAELGEVQAQYARARTGVERAKDMAAPLAQLGAAQDASRSLERVREVGRSSLAIIEEAITGLPRALSDLPDSDDERIVRVRNSYERSMTRAVATLREAAEQAHAALQQVDGEDAAVEITSEHAAAREAVDQLRVALVDQGIDPDAFASYARDVEQLEKEQDALKQRIREAERSEQERDEVLLELRECWRRETALRVASASRLNDAVPLTRTDEPFVEVSVLAHGDDRALRSQLSVFRGDRRRLSDDDWDEFMQAVADGSGDVPPNHFLLGWLKELESGAVPSGFPWPDKARQERVLACFPADKRHTLVTTRVPDRITIVLRRQDGTVAGEIEEGLSVGQKCTAVLALLLAADTTPVVIDQPEDEIDNEFTYREMVPLIRKVKERRQLIIVTHDPNVPVNGDAEMIHALSAIDGRGQVKTVNGQLAVGPIDKPAVRLAVEEIMEGSEDAFRRRFDKYGF